MSRAIKFRGLTSAESNWVYGGYFLENVRKDSRICFYGIGRGQFDDDDGEMCNDIILRNIYDNPDLLD